MGVNVVKLGELCEILDSKRKPVSKKDRVAGEYPYYGATGIQDYVANYIFDESLVLVGEDGAKWGAGENTAYAISGKSWVNNHAHVLRPNRNKILDNYLIYYLNQMDLRPYITGAIIEKLNQEQLRNIEIPLPSIEEQTLVVSLMDKADEIRTKKRLANDKLDEFLKSTFISMFGDPVRNEKRFKQEVIKDLFKVVSRGKQPEYLEYSDISVINQACIYWDKFKLKNIKYHNPDSTKKTFELQKDDILITSTGTGTLGRCNVFRENGKFITDSHVTVLRNSECMSSFFVKWMLKHSSMQDKIYSDCVNGSTNQIELSKEKLLSLKLIVPTTDEQNKFTQIVEKVEEQKQKNEQVIEQMDNLFNSLSQRAFKGEL